MASGYSGLCNFAIDFGSSRRRLTTMAGAPRRSRLRFLRRDEKRGVRNDKAFLATSHCFSDFLQSLHFVHSGNFPQAGDDLLEMF